MPNLRVASIHSNIIPEKNIWYDVTGFTQKWHSIPHHHHRFLHQLLFFIGSTKVQVLPTRLNC